MQSKYLTPQEIFDKVSVHLLKQNRRAVDERGHCEYLAQNGDKCAIGALIAAENYTVMPTSYREIQEALLKSGIPVYDNTVMHLINDVRLMHDHYEPTVCPEELAACAKKFNLTFTAAEAK